MKKHILSLALLAALSFGKEQQYDDKVAEIQEMQYLFEQGEYDYIINEAARLLSDAKISFTALEQINALRIESFYEKRQYETVNQLFAQFKTGFPESKQLYKLMQLDIDSYARRRQYSDALLSCNGAINLQRGKNEAAYNEMVQRGQELITDDLTKDELQPLYRKVDTEMQAALRDRMQTEGIVPPREVKDFEKEIWNEKVTNNHFRGSALVGLNYPLSMNEDLQTIGFNGQFTGLYRLWNFFAPGAHIEFNLWRYEISDNVTVYDTVQTSDESNGNVSYAIPFYAVPRVYSPQFGRFKAFLEPGIGGAVYSEDSKLAETEFALSAMGDLGFTFQDMVEFRAGARIILREDENVMWLSASLGMVIKPL